MTDNNERIFNDDLLLNRSDVALVREVYPSVSDALDWPRLRQAFSPHEQAANQAKAKSRRRGVSALAAGLIALWLAALEPRLHDPSSIVLWVMTGAIATLGVFGVVLGSTVLIGGRKERWLHHRAATERLRQLHFQVLVRRAFQLAAADPAMAAGVMKEREQVLDLLVRDLHPGVTPAAETILGDLGGAGCWLIGGHPPVPSQLRLDVLDELFQAYAKLRFQHQVDYATRKLSTGTGLWPWEPAGQARRIDVTSYSLTLIVIACHLIAVVVVAAALGGESWLSPIMQTTGILAAIGVLALRVLEDGLRPRAEVARLRTYRGEITELFRKFEVTIEPAAKLALMERVEEVSYRELRDFLALHDEASFVL